MLDMSMMLGAVPARYGATPGAADLATYFAMARGTTGGEDGCGHGHASLTACEMTKWFDTNYHYIVPELAAGQKLAIGRMTVLAAWREARAKDRKTGRSGKRWSGAVGSGGRGDKKNK